MAIITRQNYIKRHVTKSEGNKNFVTGIVEK